MNGSGDNANSRTQYDLIVTWAMFEGLIAIIEAWFYREMPSEGWECRCDRDPRDQENTCVLCGANLASNSGDVLRVYNQLKQIVGFIDERSTEN